jgi:hypothetical protein
VGFVPLKLHFMMAQPFPAALSGFAPARPDSGMRLCMRDCSSNTCLDQFKQGPLDFLDEFVRKNWVLFFILFRPSLTPGLIHCAPCTAMLS